MNRNEYFKNYILEGGGNQSTFLLSQNLKKKKIEIKEKYLNVLFSTASPATYSRVHSYCDYSHIIQHNL